MTDLGKYGERAIRHWARWLPSTYAAIPAADRVGYFSRLDDEAHDLERNLAASSMPPESLKETDHLRYVGLVNMANLMAEEAVLAQMILLPPEPGLESEDDQDETDEMGLPTSPGWISPRLLLTEEDWAEKEAEGAWMPLRETTEAPRSDPR